MTYLQKSYGGIHRHVLAGFWRLWQRGYLSGVSERWHRASGSVAGVWVNSLDDGLCHRPCLRLSPQSGRIGRLGCGPPISGLRPPGLRYRAGAGRV